jgi:hypothetical protein
VSGGSFNYAYSHVKYFSVELIAKIELRPFNGDHNDCYAFSDEVTMKLREIAEIAEKTAKLMNEVEWLYSGDTGEETFMSHVNEINRRSS